MKDEAGNGKWREGNCVKASGRVLRPDSSLETSCADSRQDLEILFDLIQVLAPAHDTLRIKKKRSRKRLARALKRNCSVIFPRGADAVAVGDSPGVPQSLSWQSLRCMGKVCDAREAFAVIIAPAYPRRRALFEILNECTPHPNCSPTPKPASGRMPRAYPTRTTEKIAGPLRAWSRRFTRLFRS